jgi:putative colanic acid biosynthesis acetyltransferase WcaF
MLDLAQYRNPEFERGVPAWKEGAWWLVRSCLFAPWFPTPSSWKVAALRAFGAKVGQGVVIRSRVNITFPWRLEVGDHVWIGDEVLILSLAQVRIGSNVCISQRAFLCTGSHDFAKPTFDLMIRPITVGDGCWIGAQAFVGPGVVFGDSSRCFAGAVVTKEVAAGAAVGGVPAKGIG